MFGWRLTLQESQQQQFPSSIRGKAIDLYHLRSCCGEEIILLKSEVENTLDHFTKQHQLLLSSLDYGEESVSFEGRGRGKKGEGETYKLYIVHFEVLFEGVIDNVSLPTLTFQNNFLSLEQQANYDMSTELVGIYEDAPYLLSLSERETGTFDGSDSEDDDNEYEDNNVSLLSLHL